MAGTNEPRNSTHASRPHGITPTLDRNITALMRRRVAEQRESSWQQRVAAAVTVFTGSMPFVYLHLVIVGLWIVVNLGWVPGVPQFDPTFVILAMAASVEAIFLSTFVLITQNRMAAEADKRADLDLQISLLTEHELTQLASLVSTIAERMGIPPTASIDEVKEEVAPEEVLDNIERRERDTH
ncbi:MAG TPA: DUF1003 domain-containing protein [Pseudolabrys sp.]|jgi:uncharacterized membrane protein|nr:DUF1003 domain-containing protein [Pseudolabrys sp.]